MFIFLQDNSKISDFLERNRAFEEKKNQKIIQKREELTQLTDSLCFEVPNNKQVEHPRKLGEFLGDHLKYNEAVKFKVEELRKKEEDKANKELKVKPSINKKSDKMVKQKSDGRGKKVYGRLFKEQLRQVPVTKVTKTVYDPKTKKNILLTSKTEDNKKTSKLTKIELGGLVSKLHKDASNRTHFKKAKAEEYANLEQKMLNKGDLVTKSTKLIILERFVRDYEACMERLFGQKRDFDLSFDDFANILFGIGFIKVQYDSKYNENFDKNKTDNIDRTKKKKTTGTADVADEPLENRTQMYRRRNEYNFIKEAWKFLTEENTEVEKISSNQVLLFSVAVIGLYDGEGAPSSPGGGRAPIMSPIITPIPRDGSSKDVFSLEPKDVIKEENVNTNVETNVNTNENKDKDPKTNTKHNKKINSSPKRVQMQIPVSSIRIDSHSSEKNDFRKKTGRTQLTQTYTARAKAHKILLKVVLPEFDINKYAYSIGTVKRIHNSFRQFYTNRVDSLVELKKKNEETIKRSRSAEKVSKDDMFSVRANSNKSAKHYQHWKEKKFRVSLVLIIYSFYQAVADEEEQKEVEGADGVKIKRPKIHEVYNYLAKRRER